MMLFKEMPNKSVRIESVEMHARNTKGFDRLSPNGGYLFSTSLNIVIDTFEGGDRLKWTHIKPM